jgi:hypothetical protein
VSSTLAVEKLVVEFDQTSKDEHLGFSPSRNGIPGLQSLGWEASERKTVGEIAREVDTQAKGAPAHELPT